MPQAESAFVVCNDDQLEIVIKAAQRRLVVVAPALNVSVGAAVADTWRRLGPDAVAVLLDSDPEVYRLGYGQPEALTQLLAVANELGSSVRRQPGLRIGLLIADDQTLVYSPVPQLIEAGPNTNGGGATAIRLTVTPAAVARDLGLAGSAVGSPTIGREHFDDRTVAHIQDDLARNPPKKFDVARAELVFNAAFEFVEFELSGAAIGRKKVKIPNELMGFARDEHTKRLMDLTFRLIADDEDLSGRRLHDIKARIIKTYLTNLPGYGNVILRNVKPQFDRRVKQLERAVTIFQTMIEERLQAAMDKNRKALVKALLPSVLESPPKSWRKYGEAIDAGRVEQLLSEELTELFGSASALVSKMRVTKIFRGVTYQSLVDPEFRAAVKKRLPFLESTHDEHMAAPESAKAGVQKALFS